MKVEESPMQAVKSAVRSYDALLVVSFGGPEGMDEVLPFLENVLRGRNVPRERMLEVAHHYEMFGGVSPINGQNRALIAALRADLDAHGIDLPIYWGNRNWTPYVADALRQMRDDGVRHALAFFTSAYASYSGCRQYREDIVRAQADLPGAPQVDKLANFHDHPAFVAANADRLFDAFERVPPKCRADARLLFTAHSIPLSMAQRSRYVAQLNETCGQVAAALGRDSWELAYQSRSGSPRQPWLGPDICETLARLKAEGVETVVVHPVGFISDHMEILYDLDTEARLYADSLGIAFVRAETVGTHPAFIGMILECIVGRLRGERHDICAADCCLPG
jgi:ferrochelatase